MDFELLLEAERRGILPDDKKALLTEARKRGLVEGGEPPMLQTHLPYGSASAHGATKQTPVEPPGLLRRGLQRAEEVSDYLQGQAVKGAGAVVDLGATLLTAPVRALNYATRQAAEKGNAELAETGVPPVAADQIPIPEWMDAPVASFVDKRLKEEHPGYEPGGWTRATGKALEFTTGNVVPMAAALKWAPVIKEAAKEGGRSVKLLNHLTKLAADNPELFRKTETALAAITGAGAGAGRSAQEFIAPDAGPMERAAWEIAGSLAAGGAGGALIAARQAAQRNLTATGRAGKALFDGAPDDLFTSPAYREAEVLEGEFPGLRFTTAEKTGSPSIAQAQRGPMLAGKGTINQQLMDREGQNVRAVRDVMDPEWALGAETPVEEGVSRVRDRLKGVVETRRGARDVAAENWRTGVEESLANRETGVQSAQEGWRQAVEKSLSDRERAVAAGLADLGVENPHDVALTMRALLSGERDRLKAEATRLYKAVGNPRVSVDDYHQRLLDIADAINPAEPPKNIPGELGRQTKLTAPPKPEESGILDAFGNPIAVQRETRRPFEDLQTMRRAITNEIKRERGNGPKANDNKLRFLVQMQNAMEESMKGLKPDDKGAEEALRKANAFFQKYAAKYGFKRDTVKSILSPKGLGGDWYVPDEKLAETMWKGGGAGAKAANDIVDAFQAEGAPKAEALQALQDLAASHLRQYVVEGEQLTLGKLQTWKRKYGEALKAVPEVARKFDNLKSAQRSLEALKGLTPENLPSGTAAKAIFTEAPGLRPKAEAVTAAEKRFANLKKLTPEKVPTGEEAKAIFTEAPELGGKGTALTRAERRVQAVRIGTADDKLTKSARQATDAKVFELFMGDNPEAVVKGIYAAPEPRNAARKAMKLTMGDPQARAGLRRGFWEDIDRRLSASVESPHTGAIRDLPSKFKSVLDDPTRRAVLEELYTPEELAKWKKVLRVELIKDRAARPYQTSRGSDTQMNKTSVLGYISTKLFPHGGLIRGTVRFGAKSIGKLIDGINADDAAKIMEEALMEPEAARILFQDWRRIDQNKAVGWIKRLAARAGVEGMMETDRNSPVDQKGLE